MGGMPWFRVYSEILDDRKIKRIVKKTGQSKALIIGVWICILALANEGSERGKLSISDDIPYTAEDIEDETGLPSEIIEQLLDEFRSLGMINGKSTIEITNWDKRQFKSDSSTARVKKHREETKRYSNVTKERFSNVIDTDTESDIDKKQKKKRKESTAAAAAFHSHDGTAQKLYMESTGLTYIPPDGYDAIIETAKIILDQTADFDEALRLCKAEYTRWCSTKRKDNHGTYSKLNPAWMTWVLEKLAPRPEGRPKSMSEMTNKELKEHARKRQMEAKK